MALDPNAIADRVRFLLGNPSEEILPNDILLQIVNECIAKIGDDDSLYCQVLQCSLMETLRYLIRQSQIPSSPNGGSVRRRKEKRGRTEIEEEYQQTSAGDPSGWEQMYEDYQQHPEWICDELVTERTGEYLVKIGGVRQDEFDSIVKDSNSKSAYDKPRVNRKFWKSSSRPYYRRGR